MLGRCLGRRPSAVDPRTLRLVRYMREVPAPPPARDWSAGLPEDLGLYRNNELGTCGIAAAAHLELVWGAQHGQERAATDAQVLEAYAAIGGYQLGQPLTDRGTDMLSACKHWRSTGIAGRRIHAFAQLDHGDPLQLRIAINLFGGAYLGASLPVSALDTRWAWDVPVGAAGVYPMGGHTMAAVGYSHRGVWLVTWGRRQLATWRWVAAYVDEAYAVLSEDWAGGPGAELAPHGIDMAELERDLAAIGAASP